MKNVILWILLALLWSSSFLAIKLGVKTISPLNLVAMRMLIGTTVIFITLRSKSLSLPTDGKSWMILFISGMTGNIIPFYLISIGEQHVESGLTALLMGIVPVVTVLLAPLAHHDEKLTLPAIVGITVGMTGLIILVGPGVLQGFSLHVTGQLFILGAALCYAFTVLFVRKYASLPALVMAAGSMLVGTMVITVSAFVFQNPLQASLPSAQSIGAVIYLGLFPTALATLIYFYLVPRLGAARMSQVNFVVPVAGTFLGVVFLGEPFSADAFLALLMILVAVYLVSRRAHD